MPVITTNTAANTALRYVNQNSAAQNNYLSQLSSGSRVQKASDDASSLAIGTKLKGDVTALTQASVNSANGQAVLQTADGSLAQVSDILARLKALSTQSQSGSVDDTSRTSLNTEFQQLLAELDSIQAQTTFNGTSLLDGSYDQSYLLGTASTDTITITLDQDTSAAGLDFGTTAITSTSSDTDVATISGTATAADSIELEVTAEGVAGSFAGTLDTGYSAGDLDGDVLTITIGDDDYTVTVGSGDDLDDIVDAIETAIGSAGTVAYNSGTGAFSITAAATGDSVTIADDSSGAALATLGLDTGTTSVAGVDWAYTVDGVAGTDLDGSVTVNGLTVTLVGAGTTTIASTASTTTDTSVDTSVNAAAALAKINAAIDDVTQLRAKVGAYQSRLEFRAAVIDTAKENLEAARSSLMDADVAETQINYNNINVLTQAGIAAIEKANAIPQQLLRLLQS